MRTVAALLVAVCLVPAAAGAQVPAYAHPLPSADQTISGTIDAFSGKFGLTLRDDRGYLDNVSLHRGTVINPTGTQLRPGMRVTLHGHPDGNVFDVDEIDVTESEANPQPYASPYVPYDYGPYGYGYYGYGAPPAYWPVGVVPWPYAYYGYPAQVYVVPVPANPTPIPYVPPPHERRHTMQSAPHPPAMRFQPPAPPQRRATLGAPRAAAPAIRH